MHVHCGNGAEDGLFVGMIDGDSLGFLDGWVEGRSDGILVGLVDGIKLGCIEGYSVGVFQGDVDGVCVGVKLGRVGLGLIDGKFVGLLVATMQWIVP